MAKYLIYGGVPIKNYYKIINSTIKVKQVSLDLNT
jgi:hypothetical protein